MANPKNGQPLGVPGPVADDGVVSGSVGYTLKRAYMVLRPVAEAAVGEFGLRINAFSCLSVIVQNPGIAPSELAQRIMMERSNVVVVIDELESSDLITREQNRSDRRRFLLFATPKGREVVEQACAAVIRTEDHLLRRLDAAERDQLVDLLNKIVSGPDE